jgi:hypothetical protein
MTSEICAKTSLLTPSDLPWTTEDEKQYQLALKDQHCECDAEDVAGHSCPFSIVPKGCATAFALFVKQCSSYQSHFVEALKLAPRMRTCKDDDAIKQISEVATAAAIAMPHFNFNLLKVQVTRIWFLGVSNGKYGGYHDHGGVGFNFDGTVSMTIVASYESYAKMRKTFERGSNIVVDLPAALNRAGQLALDRATTHNEQVLIDLETGVETLDESRDDRSSDE